MRKFLDLAGFDYEIYHSHLFEDTDEQKSLATLLGELQEKRYKVEWRDQRNKPYEVLSASLLSQFRMNEDKDYIEFEFPSFIRESILAHQNFYILYLPVIISMKSSYSIVLYEQILQRKKFGVWYVKLEDLRELMGVEKYEYKEIADFEKRIVKPAVNEINKIINISLSYEKIKKGRNIVAYEFAWDFRNAKELYTNHNEKLKEESSKGLHSEEIQELLQIVPDLDITILESILNHFDFTKVKNAVLITAEKRKKIKLTI